jgi:cation/acetate symporter
MLMDRIGVPEGVVRACAVIFVFAGLMTIAALLRTMRVSSFYVAGRALPGPYAGLAMAALGMGLCLPFLAPAPQDTPLAGLFAGFACGMTLACLISGPLLRKTGALSVPDLISARFPQLSARLGSILLTAGISALISLAGFAEALSALQDLSGLSTPAAAVIIAAILMMCVLPGGLAGALWVATTSAIVALAVFGMPLLIALIQGAPIALPVVGTSELFPAALSRLELSTGVSETAARLNLGLVAALALGIGVLAPLLGPAVACRNRRIAQNAGVAGLFWVSLLILLIFATLLQTSLNVEQGVIGTTPETLTATSHYVLAHFADIGTYGAAFSGLAAATVMALGLSLAASGFQTAANVLGNDMIYRVRDRSALTSRRLAVTRAIALGLIGIGGASLCIFSPPPRMLIAVAILLSAATLAPVLILTLWRRATSVDATIALLVGLLTAELLIEIDPSPSNFDRFAFNALTPCLLGLLAAVLASLLRRGPSEDGAAFLRAILNNSEEGLHPDKGV